MIDHARGQVSSSEIGFLEKASNFLMRLRVSQRTTLTGSVGKHFPEPEGILQRCCCWESTKRCRRLVRSMIPAYRLRYPNNSSGRTVFSEMRGKIFMGSQRHNELVLRPLEAISVSARYCPARMLLALSDFLALRP